jgi:hypothetical protein
MPNPIRQPVSARASAVRVSILRNIDKPSPHLWALGMEKLAIKRPLESEGIPPLIENPEEAMEIFAEILRRSHVFFV